MKILFVCRANVGRSQMAEAVFSKMNSNHKVFSAGTKVVSKDGESRHGQFLRDLPDAENLFKALHTKGIDVTQKVRIQLDRDMVEDADMVIVMAEQDTIPDYLSKSPKVIYWNVADPKGSSVEGHIAALDQISDLVKDLIKKYNL
jgi:protein-tyrosine-phosphatase